MSYYFNMNASILSGCPYLFDSGSQGCLLNAYLVHYLYRRICQEDLLYFCVVVEESDKVKVARNKFVNLWWQTCPFYIAAFN